MQRDRQGHPALCGKEKKASGKVEGQKEGREINRLPVRESEISSGHLRVARAGWDAW